MDSTEIDIQRANQRDTCTCRYINKHVNTQIHVHTCTYSIRQVDCIRLMQGVVIICKHERTRNKGKLEKQESDKGLNPGLSDM